MKYLESFVGKWINKPRNIEQDSIRQLIEDHLIDLDEFDVKYEINEDTLTIIDYADHALGYEQPVRNDKIFDIIKRLFRLLLEDEFVIEELSITDGYSEIGEDRLVSKDWIETPDYENKSIYWVKKFLIYED